MVVSTNCCLNLLPPTPTSTTSISFAVSRTAEIACPPKKIRSWKSQCVLGLTCAVIGLEILDNFISKLGDEQQQRAIALDHHVEQIARVQRWSDKGGCKAWRLNSLETIVPENLPRASIRRRWEGIGLLEAEPKSGQKSCFYM